MYMVDQELDPWLPNAAHKHCCNNAAKQQEVDLAIKAKRLMLFISRRFGKAALFLQERGIDHEIERQQDHGKHEHWQEHMGCRPEEAHALQEPEEERWIAKRGQRAADIRDQENEKYDRVNTIAPTFISAHERADQQHGCARGPHPARHERTKQQNAGVQHRRPNQPTTQPNPARDCEQG